MQCVRIALVLSGGFLFSLGLALLIHPMWVLELWLWPDAPWLSHVFMASVFFAYACGSFVVAIQGKWRPLRTLSLGGLVSFGGLALYLYHQAAHGIGGYDYTRLTNWGRIMLLYTILCALFIAAAENRPFTKLERIPRSLRAILAILIAINLAASLRLVVADQAFAWELTDEMAIAYGWTLLGAATLAFLTCLEPYWENVWLILATLIAYGLTLLGPIVYLLFRPMIVETHFFRAILFLIFVLGSLAAAIGYTIHYSKTKRSN